MSSRLVSSSAAPPDYTLLYRRLSSVEEVRGSNYDLLITAVDGSDRTRLLLDAGTAVRVVCAVLPQYQFSLSEIADLEGQYPAVLPLVMSSGDEADFANELLRRFPIGSGFRVCLDLSGFPRTHLCHLVLRLISLGVSEFDAMYIEPEHYVYEEETVFAEGTVGVRPIRGFEGVDRPNRTEVLLIGTGFDVDVMNEVARQKPGALKLQLFGLPSLQPEMYQQNLLRTIVAGDAVEDSVVSDRFFAPAYCPFETAQTVQQALRRAKSLGQNLYLAPLGTKVQALGFTLYYLHECMGQRATMFGVTSSRLRRASAVGVGRVWRYELRMLG